MGCWVRVGVYEERGARLCLDEAWDLARVLYIPLVCYSTAHGNGAAGFPMPRMAPAIRGGGGSIAPPFLGSLRPGLAFR